MNVLSVLEDVEETEDGGSMPNPPGGAGQGLYGPSMAATRSSLCNCSRNNSLLFETWLEDIKSGSCGQDNGQDKSRAACLREAREREPSGVRFGTDYGTQCAVITREENRNKTIMI